jgi:hypothetical protein
MRACKHVRYPGVLNVLGAPHRKQHEVDEVKHAEDGVVTDRCRGGAGFIGPCMRAGHDSLHADISIVGRAHQLIMKPGWQPVADRGDDIVDICNGL